jgi:Family of unknown function (DUF6130)
MKAILLLTLGFILVAPAAIPQTSPQGTVPPTFPKTEETSNPTSDQTAPEEMPQLTIESPTNGENIRPTPQLGAVVIIKFATGNFTVEKLSEHSRHEDETGMAHIGHLNVTVDKYPWYFVHATGDPVVIAGLTPGRHTVKLELVRSDHKPLNPPVVRTVTFTMTDGMGRQRQE